MVRFWTYYGETTGFAARMRSLGQIQGQGPEQLEDGAAMCGEGEDERGASGGWVWGRCVDRSTAHPDRGAESAVYEDTHLGAVSTWVVFRAEELGEVTWGESEESKIESGAAGHTSRFEREQRCIKRDGEGRASEVRAKTRSAKSQSQVREAVQEGG